MGGAIETAQWVGLILSPVFLVGVLVWKLTLDIIDCRMPLRRSRVNSVLIFSAGLLFSVWALRFSVGCYMTGVKDTDVAGKARFKRLDLTDMVVREKVISAINNDELDHIFDTDGFFD